MRCVTKPIAGSVANIAHRQHYRNFHKNTHYSRKSGSGRRAEERDGYGYRKFKEVACPNESPRRGDVVRDLEPTHRKVGQAGIEIDLNDDGHSK